VTAEEIGRAGLIVRVFGRFKVRVRSSGKSWTLKGTGLIVRVFGRFEVKVSGMCVVIGLRWGLRFELKLPLFENRFV
jgi:hypothetical protein